MVDIGARARHDAGVFVGEFVHQVDANGRITLPSTFREELTGECYLRRDPLGYLVFIPAPAFEAESADVQAKMRSGEAPRSALRQLASTTRKVTIDKNGRVTLDEEARQHAGLRPGGTATLVGESYTFSVWRPSRWQVLSAEDGESTPVRVWDDEDDE